MLLAGVGIVAVTGAVMVFALRAIGWAKVVPEIFKEHPPTHPGAWRRLTRHMVERSGWARSFPSTTELQPVLPEADEQDEVDGERE